MHVTVHFMFWVTTKLYTNISCDYLVIYLVTIRFMLWVKIGQGAALESQRPGSILPNNYIVAFFAAVPAWLALINVYKFPLDNFHLKDIQKQCRVYIMSCLKVIFQIWLTVIHSLSYNYVEKYVPMRQSECKLKFSRKYLHVQYSAGKKFAISSVYLQYIPAISIYLIPSMKIAISMKI